MEIIKSIVIALGGYIYGSVNFSVLISSIFHKRDIRRTGSGNAGATNMARLFGIKAGLGTMLGDMFKTVLALLTGYFIFGNAGICISGIFCLLGHCFPVFYEFKGGKGVSAGAVVALFISPLVFAVAVLMFVVFAFASRKVSLGSIAAALAVSITSFMISVPAEFKLLALFTTILVIARHHENIKRLIKGTEPDFRPAR